MPRIQKTAAAIIAVIGVFALVSASPIYAGTQHEGMSVPDIRATITIPEGAQNYADYAQISLGAAMESAEGAVEGSKAVWGKLKTVQGFLVYKIAILSDDTRQKVLVDAADGNVLFVSDAMPKYKHSDKKHRDHYANMTPEQMEQKKRQWGEVKEAFLALSLDERARMIMHFMSLKAQWQSMSDEQQQAQKQEMKSMMQELLPLSLEEKTQKLRAFAASL